MSIRSVGIVILAAGEGTRLRASCPKPLVDLCGRKLIDFPLIESLSFAQNLGLKYLPVVVTGHGREQVESYLSGRAHFAFQRERKGTADALLTAFSLEELKGVDVVMVLCADTPHIRERELLVLYRALLEEDVQGVAAVFRAADPKGYGRVISGSPGFRIVEERVASPQEREIDLVNSGVYLFRVPFLLDHLAKIQPRVGEKEAYLTDIFQQHLPVKDVFFSARTPFLGVNTPRQLSHSGHRIRQEINERHQENGVRIVDHRHTYIDWDVVIEPGSVIHPHNFIYSGTHIGSEVTIEPMCLIRETEIRSHGLIKSHSHLERALIREGATIGPFARIRIGSDIGEGCKVGNFVETKNAELHAGVKASHLSYLGDIEVGEKSNIGCGFIACNYDGLQKHQTVLGKEVFIGSSTKMIAPVRVGDGAFIGAGSTINCDVPDGAFAIARARQVNKEGGAERFKK